MFTEPITTLLAADFGDIPPKLIFWVFVGAIWLISSIMSGLKKAIQGKPTVVPRPVSSTIDMAVMQPVPPAAPRRGVSSTAQAMGETLRAQFAAQAGSQIRTKQKQKRRAVPPPLIIQPSSSASPAPISIAPPMAPVTVKTPLPNLNLRQLLRPESLRNQWILTEILGKPLALREEFGRTSR